MLRRAVVGAVLALSFGTMSTAVAQTPGIPASTPIVIGQSWRLASAILGEARELNVWLPPGYADGERRYPVLYLLDGGIDQDFHHISGLAQLGTIAGSTRDIIVVGFASRDRRNELALRSENPDIVASYPTQGQSDRFRRHLAEEAIPFVEATFRTDGYSVLMGESLAGLFVVETLLKQPDLFDAYVAVSPSLWWDDGVLASQAGRQLRSHEPIARTLILSVEGDRGETDPTIKSLVDGLHLAAPTGLELIYDPRPAESHETIYHGAALDALRVLFPPPAE